MNENERGGCTAEHGSESGGGAGPKSPLGWRLAEQVQLSKATIWDMP